MFAENKRRECLDSGVAPFKVKLFLLGWTKESMTTYNIGNKSTFWTKKIDGKMLTHMCVGTTYAKRVDTRPWLLVRRKRSWNFGYPQPTQWN